MMFSVPPPPPIDFTQINPQLRAQIESVAKYVASSRNQQQAQFEAINQNPSSSLFINRSNSPQSEYYQYVLRLECARLNHQNLSNQSQMQSQQFHQGNPSQIFLQQQQQQQQQHHQQQMLIQHQQQQQLLAGKLNSLQQRKDSELNAAITKSYALKLDELSVQCNIENDSFLQVIQPVIDNCNNGTISQAKSEVLRMCISPLHFDYLMFYLIVLESNSTLNQSSKVSLLYLLNDIIYHLSSVGHKAIINRMESLMPPFLHFLLLSCHQDEEIMLKIGNVFQIWTNSKQLSPQIIHMLNNRHLIASKFDEFNNFNFKSAIDPIVIQYENLKQEVHASILNQMTLQTQPPPNFSQNLTPSLNVPPPAIPPPSIQQSMAQNQQHQPIDQNPPNNPLPYYELPAGLMLTLFEEHSKKRYPYEPIDPNELKIPQSVVPTTRILALMDSFYSNLLNWKTKDKYGFEKDSCVNENEVVDKLLPPQNIPDLVSNYENLLKNKTARKKSKKELVDEMKFDFESEHLDSDSLTLDEIFNFDSSDEEKNADDKDQAMKIMSSLAQNINNHHRVYTSKVELAKLKAEQAAKSINPIESTNKGHKLLQMMGWSKGKGLGAKESGIVNPIKADGSRLDSSSKNLGLGANKNFSNTIDEIKTSNNDGKNDSDLMIENFRALKKMKHNQQLDMRRAERNLSKHL